jgi:hypothetical protein
VLPVLPPKYAGLRAMWRRTGSVCEPGRSHRQPLASVAGCRASHSPMQVWRGVVKRKQLSWCEVASPPIRGCLKMYLIRVMSMGVGIANT